MQKWGKNRKGSQRYFCRFCNNSETRKRPEIVEINHEKIFVSWLLGKLSKSEIAEKYGVTRRTLVTWFAPFWSKEPLPKEVSIANKVLIVDGKYVERNACVLLASCNKKVASWHFSYRENYSSWRTFFDSFNHVPFAIVCDGQRGMLKAIKQRFPGLIVQRCQFHVVQYCTTRLTKKPESQAAQEFRKLVLQVSRVKTKRHLQIWLAQYKYWYQSHKEFLKEKTYQTTSFTPTGRKKWHYTHGRLHAAHSHLKNALPYLFRYLEHPQVQNTTSLVEGAINSPMQEKLRFHRGLRLEKRRILIAHFLPAKQ